MLLSCALIAALGVVVNGDDKTETIDAKKLVGKWELVERSTTVKVVVEFSKDGKLSVSETTNGKEEKSEGTYKVEGNKVITTLKTDRSDGDTFTITKLTDTEMTTKDIDGKEDMFRRIKVK
jgi:uncharacterized protein (TIGR03066 family)